jgi:DNA-binding NtrC family response regulator
VIGPEYLGPDFLTPGPKPGGLSRVPVRPGIAMKELERRLLESTLDVTRGNRTRAAEMLGISLRTIRNKIREYGLPPRRYA